MSDVHTTSNFLRDIWQEINRICFGSKLTEPSTIGWIDISAEAGLTEEFGYYFFKQNGIALSHRFQYAEVQDVICKKVSSDPMLSLEQKQEELCKFNAYEIVYLLMVHEMIHQASHQAGESATSHGEPFLKHAKGVAEALEIAEPTAANASQWPSIAYFLELEIQSGHVSA